MLPYIVAGEILFWCLLLGGLAFRYLMQLRLLSTLALLATPFVDVAIITLTYVDLAAGASSDFSHGMAAFYVGFSIVFGPEIIRRYDRWFARRYTDLPQSELPRTPQQTDVQYLIRCVVASVLTLALLAVGLLFAGDLDRSFWLIYWCIVAMAMPVLWAIVDVVRRRRRRSAGARKEHGR